MFNNARRPDCGRLIFGIRIRAYMLAGFSREYFPAVCTMRVYAFTYILNSVTFMF